MIILLNIRFCKNFYNRKCIYLLFRFCNYYIYNNIIKKWNLRKPKLYKLRK